MTASLVNLRYILLVTWGALLAVSIYCLIRRRRRFAGACTLVVDTDVQASDPSISQSVELSTRTLSAAEPLFSKSRCSIAWHIPQDANQTILTKALAESLLGFLPGILGVPGAATWALRYSTKVHGMSMATLIRNISDCEKTVLVVQDAEGYVFGGFGTERWQPSGHFFGTGESFVFRSGSSSYNDAGNMQVFPWNPSGNDFFMYCSHQLMAFGCDAGRFALALQSDLLHGESSPSVTFGNPSLAASERFVVRGVEFWALELDAP